MFHTLSSKLRNCCTVITVLKKKKALCLGSLVFERVGCVCVRVGMGEGFMSLFLYSFDYILQDMPSFIQEYDTYFPRFDQKYSTPLFLIPLVTHPNLGPHFAPGHFTASSPVSILTAPPSKPSSHSDLSKYRPTTHKVKASLPIATARVLQGLPSMTTCISLDSQITLWPYGVFCITCTFHPCSCDFLHCHLYPIAILRSWVENPYLSILPGLAPCYP